MSMPRAPGTIAGGGRATSARVCAAGQFRIVTGAGLVVFWAGRSTWFVGVLVLMVYLIVAMTLYLLPPVPNDPSA